MPTLETPRLMLRTWQADDFEPFAAMMADADVMAFLSMSGKPMSRFEAWQALSAMVGHWTLRGFGMFAVVEHASGDLIGRVGPWHPEGWPDFEIGWTLRRQSWGLGYATEAARACVDYAFTVLNRSSLVSLIAPENTRSIRVAERLGEQLEGEARLPHHPPDRTVLQYRLSRDEWHARRA
jgi:RimJ/RimL family protein N-acetyltransferase